MAAAKGPPGGAGGARLDPATAARMQQIQEEMSRARVMQLQLQREQEDRLKALELMAAADKVVGQQAAATTTPEATAPSSSVEPTRSLPVAAMPSPLDILAEASATAATAKGDATFNDTAATSEQQLLLDVMEKYQQQQQ